MHFLKRESRTSKTLSGFHNYTFNNFFNDAIALSDGIINITSTLKFMETRKTPLEQEKYYHIYNRGINGQKIFFEEKNYIFFLQKYGQYVNPFVDTFAYCLLKNHFHILIRTKGEEEIRKVLGKEKEDRSISWILSHAFASLFKSYAQAINKGYDRTGGLFEEPFHRIEVEDEVYYSWLLWYIHYNPQKHGFVKDYRNYMYSSYHSHLLEKDTKLRRDEVLDWFGGREEYLKFHAIQHSGYEKKNAYFLEFD